jgi:hypothetical protein
MNAGQMIFTQVIEFMQLKPFHRCAWPLVFAQQCPGAGQQPCAISLQAGDSPRSAVASVGSSPSATSCEILQAPQELKVLVMDIFNPVDEPSHVVFRAVDQSARPAGSP